MIDTLKMREEKKEIIECSNRDKTTEKVPQPKEKSPLSTKLAEKMAAGVSRCKSGKTDSN